MMNKLQLCIPTLLGTESLIATEVRNLGYETTEVTDGRVTFEGDFEAICLANINLRCAERVMIKLGEFNALSFDDLFEGVKALPWENYIGKDDCFPVKGHSLKSTLHSVPDCQSIIKKAIVERLSAKYKLQWFEEIGPVFPVQFAILKDVCSVYIDTTGVNLYKRGYRTKSVYAPMRETLACAMLEISRWQGDRPFMDPLCGSGTLPIEAAMKAKNIAPGLKRHFTSEMWRNIIPPKVWKEIREEAKQNIKDDVTPLIYASDIDPHAIEMARKNAINAGVADCINFKVCDVSEITHFDGKGVIMCNPPYGERILDKKACAELYGIMGRKFRENPYAKQYILTSNEEFEKFYGKKSDKKRKLYNGMLKCYVYQYFRM